MAPAASGYAYGSRRHRAQQWMWHSSSRRRTAGPTRRAAVSASTRAARRSSLAWTSSSLVCCAHHDAEYGARRERKAKARARGSKRRAAAACRRLMIARVRCRGRSTRPSRGHVQCQLMLRVVALCYAGVLMDFLGVGSCLSRMPARGLGCRSMMSLPPHVLALCARSFRLRPPLLRWSTRGCASGRVVWPGRMSGEKARASDDR